ncbi:hypothetical protein M7I_5091 [Glarea lozoyensis 74030]|uniref:Uncharacterized protein n=1 Tax=Glarea lozoyensis (strain ATCC 74030 / MF5533) TaxID=1104152 RepID=H0EQY2_GLAL7|nr:hypothetical protein M7I_5091 [Glarea lozoyensis 74030]
MANKNGFHQPTKSHFASQCSFGHRKKTVTNSQRIFQNPLSDLYSQKSVSQRRTDTLTMSKFEREKTNVIVQLKAKKHVAEVEEMFENIGKDVKQEMKVEEKKFFDTWEDYRDWEGYAEKLSDNCKGDKDMRIMDNVEVSKISGRTRGVTVSLGALGSGEV